MSGLRIRNMVAVVLMLKAAAAVAQNGGEMGYDFYRPITPLPPELQFTYHHASTALEGALRGQAQVIHASGNYWLSISQAMICREQARAVALANRQYWIEHRISLRQWYEHKRQRRIEELRRANEAKRPSKYAVYRLDSKELDRLTGAIQWPTALQSMEFAPLRSQLESLFMQRVVSTSPVDAIAAEVTTSSRRLGAALRRHRTGMDRNDYLAAQKFVCGLGYEVEAAPVHPDKVGPSPKLTAQVERPWSK